MQDVLNARSEGDIRMEPPQPTSPKETSERMVVIPQSEFMAVFQRLCELLERHERGNWNVVFAEGSFSEGSNPTLLISKDGDMTKFTSTNKGQIGSIAQGTQDVKASNSGN